MFIRTPPPPPPPSTTRWPCIILFSVSPFEGEVGHSGGAGHAGGGSGGSTGGTTSPLLHKGWVCTGSNYWEKVITYSCQI